MKKILGLAFLLIAVAPASAIAQDAWYNGIYLGFGVGAGRLEADLNKLGLLPANAAGTPEAIESDEYKKTSFAGSVLLGYRFGQYFAIEGGYTSFKDTSRQFCFIDDTGGCAERRSDIGQPTTPATSSSAWTVELPTDVYKFYVVGLFPFNKTIDIFAKVGAIGWEADAAGYEKIVGGFVPPKPPLVPPTNVPVTKTLDGTDAAAGIGLNFNHPSGVTVRAEFEYFDIGDFDTSYLANFSAFYTF
ncbi:MAG: outer membrane beta-barrel protein [Gammaproteobacteria bacterium]